MAELEDPTFSGMRLCCCRLLQAHLLPDCPYYGTLPSDIHTLSLCPSGTVFVPKDEAFVDDAKDIQEALGVSVFDLPGEPTAAAKVRFLQPGSQHFHEQLPHLTASECCVLCSPSEPFFVSQQ